MRTRKHIPGRLPAILTALAAASLAIGIRAAEDPYGVASWPDEPEWRSLTNHLDQCHRAVVDRYLAVNASTNLLTKPSLVYPYQDYVNLAAAIDALCGSYVVHTHADSNGNFDAWLATTNELPHWSPETLHAHCGFTNWSDSLLTSWAVCDRSIQTQIVAAVNALQMTAIWAVPYAADSPGRQIVWEGFGWDVAATNACTNTVSSGLWPHAYAESETTALYPDWPNLTPYTNSMHSTECMPWADYGYHVTGSGQLQLGWIPPENGRKPWFYRVYLQLRSQADDENHDYYFPGDGYTTIPDVSGGSWTTTGFATLAEPGFPVADEKVGIGATHFSFEIMRTETEMDESEIDLYSPICTTASSATAYVRAERVARRIRQVIACGTNAPSTRTLYLFGHMPQFPLSGGSPGQWAPEIDGLATGKYVACYSLLSTSNNTVFTGADLAATPYVNDATVRQKGWAVAGGFWVLDWQFSDTPLPWPATPAPRPPDTEMDGIVNTLRGALEPLEPYGSAFYLPDWNQPYVRIELDAQPRLADALTVHAELTSGRGEGLAYRLFGRASGVDYGGGGMLPPLESPYFHLNLNTCVVETRSVESPDRRERKVTVLRPNGRLVVFEFPWTNGTFSTVGFPVGIDADRTYTFDASTWQLRFADGVYHAFHPIDFGYGMSALAAVGRADGCYAVANKPSVGTDAETGLSVEYSQIRTVSFRRAEYGETPGGTRTLDISSGALNLGTWTRALATYDDGMLASVQFSRNGTNTVGTTVLRDSSGRVSGLVKQGFGADASSLSIDAVAGTIIHTAVTERLAAWCPPGQPGEGRIVYEAAAGGGWETSWQFDRQGRLTRRGVEANGGTIFETWAYGDATGRHFSGVPRNAVAISHMNAIGSLETVDLDAETGWPANRSEMWRGLPVHTVYDYDAHEGLACNPTNPVERAFTETRTVGGALVSHLMVAFRPLTDGDLTAIPFEVNQICRRAGDASTTWHDAETLGTNVIRRRSAWISAPYLWGLGTVLKRETLAEGSRDLPSNISLVRLHRDGRQYRLQMNNAGYPVTVEEWFDPVLSNWDRAYMNLPSSNSDFPVRSLQVVAEDQAGRPLVTAYSDGTAITNANWCLWGPQTVPRRDGTVCLIQYYDFGRVKRIEEPDLGRVIVIAADPLGLDTTWTVTQGGATRTTRIVRDLLGRPTRHESEAGLTQWNYAPTDDGWQATITRTGFGDIVAEYYDDGTLKSVYGPGAQRCHRSSWSPVDGKLCNTVTALEADGTPTAEWVRIDYNTLGQAVSITCSGIAEPATVEYDAAGRPWRLTDASGIVRILNHDERIGIERAGLKRGGDDGLLEPGGSDRMARFGRAVAASGVTRQAGIYAAEGDAAETPLLSEWSSHDGRHATAARFGRNTSADLSPFTGPGAFTLDLSQPNGLETLTYGPQGLLGVERRDGHGALLDATTIVRAADGLSVELASTSDGNLHAAFDLAGRLLGLAGDEGALDIQYLPGTDLPTSIVGNGEYRTLSYHSNGLPRTVAASREPPCELEWDSQGRLKSLTTQRNGQSTVTAWVHHPQTGRLLRKEVGGQTIESYTWRANGQLASVTKPGGASLTLQYDAGGDPVETAEVAPGLENESLLTRFDRLGYVATNGFEGSLTESFARDLDGAPQHIGVEGHGVVPDHSLAYARDTADGGILGFTLTTDTGTRPVTTLRDAAGRVTNLTDGAVSAAYTWDARRNRSVALAVNGTASLILSNGWNHALGVRTNLTWTLPGFNLQPSSFGLIRGPGTNRIASIVREDGSRAEIGYDADGRLASWSRLCADGSSDTTREYAYSYDGAGNVVRAGRVDAAGQGRAAFEADALNFHAVRRWNAIDLVGVAREDAWVLVDGKPVLRDGRRFVYSLPLVEGAPAHVTNLTVLARVSDDDEEWVAQRSVTLRLPACPEAIDVALAGATVGDSLSEYLFDARNRLRRVTDKVGAPRLRAVYDYYPDGRRARKIVSVWTNEAWQASCSNQFIYDRWNLVREVVASDGATTTRDYTWGLDLAGLQNGSWGQESGGIGGLLAITETSGTSTNILLPISDHVGTIHALVAVMTNSVLLAEPIIVETRTYSPYGELIEVDCSLPTANCQLPTAHCPFGFQSKYYEAETGFWYYGYRFYDARSCKWLTADPLQESGGLNMTAFCGGDPVNIYDPDGRNPVLLAAAAIWFILDKYAWAPGTEITSVQIATAERQESLSDVATLIALPVGGLAGMGAKAAGARTFFAMEASGLGFAATRNAVLQTGDRQPGFDIEEFAASTLLESQAIVLLEGGVLAMYAGGRWTSGKLAGRGVNERTLANAVGNGNLATQSLKARNISKMRYFEYEAVRAQGYKATEAYSLMKQFDMGINPGQNWGFHFTTGSQAPKILSESMLRPSGSGIWGPGIYAGTTPMPSHLLKNVPYAGWGLWGKKANVRIPIEIRQSVVYPWLPPKTVIFRDQILLSPGR